MSEEPVVAVGLLTARDLDVLGQGFRRFARVEEDDMFAELIAKLNDIPSSPTTGNRPNSWRKV